MDGVADDGHLRDENLGEQISESLFKSPPRPAPQIKERVGINARSSMTRLVGCTPLVFLNNVCQRCNATITCKMEDRNPSSGLADRVALACINNLETRKLITPGKSILVEVVCGSGGTAFAFLGAVRGYKVVCVLSEAVPMEKRVMAKAYGADVVVTPSSKGIRGVIFKAKQIVEDRPYSVLCNPWEDPVSVAVHQATTGPEIWEDTRGLVDVLVAPVCTGGTVTGAGRYLKSQNPNLRVVAVEPAESAVLSGGKAGPHKLQDMGLGLVPPLLDLDLVDEVFKVHAEQGVLMARTLARKEGMLVGPAAGAAIFAALEIARRPDMHDKLVVVIVGTPGSHCLSSLYDEVRRQCQSMSICRESEFKNMPKERPKAEA